MRAKPACTSVKSLVSLATCMTLFASEEYAIRACPSSSCAIRAIYQRPVHQGRAGTLNREGMGKGKLTPSLHRCMEMENCRRSAVLSACLLQGRYVSRDLEDGEVSAHVPVRPEAVDVGERPCDML